MRIKEIVISLLLALTSQASWSSISGFWYDPDTSVVLELTEKKAIFSIYQNYSDIQHVVNYEIIDENRIHFISDRLKISSVAELDDNNILHLKKLKNVTGRLNFKKPVSLDPQEILGSWYSLSEESNVKSEAIYYQRENNYDYQHLTLNHENKTYKKESGSNIKCQFKYGFMFYEPADRNANKEENIQLMDSIYFIEKFENNVMTLRDVDGYTWSQTKVKNPTLSNIPSDYKLDKSE